jgi:hypothetical protein
MLLCEPLRLCLRAPVVPLRVLPPVLVQVLLAQGVPAALPSSQSS